MLAYMGNVMEGRRRDEGASAVEYGLLIAAIAALIVVAVFAIGNLVQGAFEGTCEKLNDSPVTEEAEDCVEAPA